MKFEKRRASKCNVNCWKLPPQRAKARQYNLKAQKETENRNKCFRLEAQIDIELLIG